MDEVSWWKRGVIYQIYPRSFQDSNSDGVGDLEGIRRRLPYFQWLGVDAIWISPIYPSPMADFGYDVSNYCDIDPLFGSMADFDALLTEVHGLGLRVILDFVPNHTSEEHPWFKESRSARRNPKRDWYIWRDPAPGGGPPNNWGSNFGGTAWELDRASGQYYYHAFLKEQPDLNWHNPEVRRAMFDVLRFWLDRGVDGFRVDVIWHLAKDQQFRDNPINPGYQPGDASIRQYLQIYSADRPEVHDIVAEMRAVIDEYEGRVLIGEIYLPIDRLVSYYGEDLRGTHLPFNFQLIEMPWNARGISQMIEEYEKSLPAGGWPNWVLGNHDQKRIAARLGEEQARIAAMLLLTLRGTPTLYYGDEIAMPAVPIPADRVRDPWEKREPGLGLGRDPSRTPMQWDATRYGEFSDVEPWLPLSEDHEKRNVARLSDDSGSILTLYRRLIVLRRERACLAVGTYEPVEAEGGLIAYERRLGQDRLLIVLNLGEQPALLLLPGGARRWRPVLAASLRERDETFVDSIELGPNEGWILEPQG